MSDYHLQLLDEFRSEVPTVDEPTVERALACITAKAADRRRSPLRRLARRQHATPAIAVAALLLAAASVAAVKEGPWWQSGAPPVDPQAVVSVARDNMPANVKTADARTVVTADDAALVAVPLDETGYCLIPALDGRASFGSSCVYQVTHPQQGDSDSAQLANRAATSHVPGRWIAYGRITDPRAAKIDLGAFSVALVPGGFFLAQVPEAEWATLNGTANEGSILDSSGHVLRKGCVNWGPSPDDPDTTGSSHASTPLWINASGSECKPLTVPQPPTIDLNQAETVFDVTLTQPFSIWKAGQQITFVKAPASDGTSCVIANGPGLPQAPTDHGCTGTRIAPSRSAMPPIDAGIGAGLSHQSGKAFYAWEINGSTDPSAEITKLTLRSPSASAEVSYRENFFFAQLPVTTPGPRVGAVPFPPGPWLLIGYDASGQEVARVDLNELQHRASPH